MRGLGQGQTLHIFVVGEMEKLLSEALGSRPSSEKFAAHVVAFLVTNSCRLEQMQDGQLQVQNLGTCWRRRALAQILERQGGKEPTQVFVSVCVCVFVGIGIGVGLCVCACVCVCVTLWLSTTGRGLGLNGASHHSRPEDAGCAAEVDERQPQSLPISVLTREAQH